MKHKIYILTILLFFICSCESVKKKGQDIKGRTEVKLNNKLKDLADKIFPRFDKYEPNTKFNKKRFKEYLKEDVSEKIDSIYTFGDFIGLDYKILITFKSDSSTINKIVKKNNMVLSNSKFDNGLYFPDEYIWWNKKAIEEIKPFKRIDKNGDRFYLWYNTKTKKAYYEQFSM